MGLWSLRGAPVVGFIAPALDLTSGLLVGSSVPPASHLSAFPAYRLLLPPSYPSMTPGCPQVTQLNGQAAGRHVVHVGELVDQLSKPAVLHVGEQGQLLQHVRIQTARLMASFP